MNIEDVKLEVNWNAVVEQAQNKYGLVIYYQYDSGEWQNLANLPDPVQLSEVFQTLQNFVYNNKEKHGYFYMASKINPRDCNRNDQRDHTQDMLIQKYQWVVRKIRNQFKQEQFDLICQYDVFPCCMNTPAYQSVRWNNFPPPENYMELVKETIRGK